MTRRRPTNHCTRGGGIPYTSTVTVAEPPSERVSGFCSCESSMCGALGSPSASVSRARGIVFDMRSMQLPALDLHTNTSANFVNDDESLSERSLVLHAREREHKRHTEKQTENEL